MSAGAESPPDARPADLAAVRDRLAREPGELSPHRVALALRETGRPVGDAAVLAVYEALRRDVVGAGPLEPLLRLPGVTDVLVNGPDRVYLGEGEGDVGCDDQTAAQAGQQERGRELESDRA